VWCGAGRNCVSLPRGADYWQQQAYAAMLVIRTTDGETRWMDVSAYLKRESAGGVGPCQSAFRAGTFGRNTLKNETD